jgi:hypothetical protein
MRPETKGPVVTDAELAEMRERAAKWVLTPAQAKARDGAAGYFDEVFDERDAEFGKAPFKLSFHGLEKVA